MSGALYRLLSTKGEVKLKWLLLRRVVKAVPGTVAGRQAVVLYVEVETWVPEMEAAAKQASHCIISLPGSRRFALMRLVTLKY